MYSLVAWGRRLISGHESGVIRVWNVATGACEGRLDGHSGSVYCLAVSGARLLSGSQDKFVKVWTMGAGAAWPCEWTLAGHERSIEAVAAWRGTALSGSMDGTVRAWDLATGAHVATLAGHEDMVSGLAIHGDRLFSSSGDGTIRMCALGAWAALRKVEAYYNRRPGVRPGPPGIGRQVPYALLVSGSKLVSGSVGRGGLRAGQQYEVRVWDLGTLECEHTLPQPAGAEVWCLAAGRGALWGAVGKEVVVWGL